MGEIKDLVKLSKDASKKLRDQLKANYVQVPPLSPKVTLYDYLKLARNLYYAAASAYKKCNLKGAYIDFHKFQILILERLPLHKEYNSQSRNAQEIRKWINVTKFSALKYLEHIVRIIDEEQYRLVLHEHSRDELDLIDEFDSEPAVITAPQPSQMSVGNDVSATRLNSLINECDRSAGSSTTAVPTITQLVPGTATTVLHQSLPVSTPEEVLGIDYTVESDGLGFVDCDISAYEEHRLAGLAGLCSTDVEILSCIPDYTRFYVPPPTTSVVDVTIGGCAQAFLQDDFHVSFGGFLGDLPVELQMSRSAVETNRCFFLHLGIAARIHPFVLQTAFRYYASTAMADTAAWYVDVVSTVNEYSGFVDANALSLLWPAELDSFVVCLVSGALANPLLSVFAPAGKKPTDSGLTELYIRCDGDHFTLLRPYTGTGDGGGPQSFRILEAILELAREARLPVQFNEVQPSGDRSVRRAVADLLSSSIRR